MVEVEGLTKIVYIDVAQLGDYSKLSFGENAKVTPFNKIQIDSFDIGEVERKLNKDWDLVWSSFLSAFRRYHDDKADVHCAGVEFSNYLSKPASASPTTAQSWEETP